MADKSFGVKELNLLNASGTPTVTSPNNLNLNANTVAISTSCTIGNNLTVTSTTNSANLNVTGIGTLTRGFATDLSVSGISTISQPSNANPHSLWDVVNNGASAYRFTGPGQDGAEDNPNIYLVRGQRYIFKVNASGHPFQLRVANGGAAYSDGVTNNGAQSGNVVINVQHDAPAQLYYQCTNHGGMVGNIYIVGGPQVISGVVTATTFSGSGASLTNLPAANLTGTLPAISGANLTSLPAQATIANNADNRVITGGSGVNLNGEANFTYDGDVATITRSANSAGGLSISNTNNSQASAHARLELSAGDNSSAIMRMECNGHSNELIADGSGNFRIDDNGTERLRIDSSGRVLIGTTTEGESTADNLTIADSGSCGITIRSGTSSEGNIFFSDGTSGNAEYEGTIQYNHGSNYLLFFVNGSEAIRITSDGSVGINETSPAQQLHVHDDTSYHGILINGNGAPSLSFGHNTSTTPSYKFGLWGVDHTIFALTASDNHTNPLMLWDWNENGTNATVTTSVKHTFNGVCTFNSDYQQGNSTYGLVFYGSSASSRGVVVSHGNNDFRPTHTNSVDLGTSSIRWKQLYTNNSVNTSDKNLKNTILDSDLGLSFINKLRPVSYKWNQKEEESLDTKTHYGLIAQEIETALTSEGKSLNDFAGVFKPDDYKEDGTGGAMGISLGEIISPLIKAVQELSAKVAALEGS